MSYDRTNTGTLNRNDRKEKDTHADYRGSINVGGVEYWLDGWIKTAGPNGRNPGSKFLSLSIKPKDNAQRGAFLTNAQKPTPAASDTFIDDGEIPF